jgi:hypothetical protein
MAAISPSTPTHLSPQTARGVYCTMKKILILALIASISLGGFAPSALMAQKAYNDEWKAVYHKDSKDEAFKKLVDEAKCNICHIQGANKKERNPYGAEASKVFKTMKINKESPKKDPEGFKKDIAKAFKELEALKNKEGKTYGELIKAGKLPGGNTEGK